MVDNLQRHVRLVGDGFLESFGSENGLGLTFQRCYPSLVVPVQVLHAVQLGRVIQLGGRVQQTQMVRAVQVVEIVCRFKRGGLGVAAENVGVHLQRLNHA